METQNFVGYVYGMPAGKYIGTFFAISLINDFLAVARASGSPFREPYPPTLSRLLVAQRTYYIYIY